jgi:hypothetical protein
MTFAGTARQGNSRRILEGVLELDGEVNAILELLDRLVFIHVPGDGGVAAGLVDG